MSQSSLLPSERWATCALAPPELGLSPNSKSSYPSFREPYSISELETHRRPSSRRDRAYCPGCAKGCRVARSALGVEGSLHWREVRLPSVGSHRVGRHEISPQSFSAVLASPTQSVKHEGVPKMQDFPTCAQNTTKQEIVERFGTIASKFAGQAEAAEEARQIPAESVQENLPPAWPGLILRASAATGSTSTRGSTSFWRSARSTHRMAGAPAS